MNEFAILFIIAPSSPSPASWIAERGLPVVANKLLNVLHTTAWDSWIGLDHQDGGAALDPLAAQG